MKTVVITGNMGSGKSTLGETLALRPRVMFIAESVENNPYLKLAYENRQEHNLLLQLHFIFERFKAARLGTAENGPPDSTNIFSLNTISARKWLSTLVARSTSPFESDIGLFHQDKMFVVLPILRGK